MIILLKILNRVKIITNKMHNNYSIIKNNVLVNGEVQINGRLKIINSGKIIFHGKCKINSGKDYNIIGGDIQTNIVTVGNGIISIGNNVGISNSTIVANACVTIEDDVFIGGSCKIYDTDFHSVYFKERVLDRNGTISKPIVIKQGAFIGSHCIILKGVTIGKRCVIGAGSVVTRDVPDDECWAGNPARFIRKIINV